MINKKIGEIMKRSEILKMTEGIYVGYNPAYTVETAITTASRRFNDKLGTNFSRQECVKMMSQENVIDCGGLDNFLVLLFQKMEQASQEIQAA